MNIRPRRGSCRSFDQFDDVAVGVFDEGNPCVRRLDSGRFLDDRTIGFLDEAFVGRVDVVDRDRKVLKGGPVRRRVGGVGVCNELDSVIGRSDGDILSAVDGERVGPVETEGGIEIEGGIEGCGVDGDMVE